MTDIIQRATVEIDVEVPVDTEASLDQRRSAICRKIRLEMGDGVSLKPPLLRKDVTLTEQRDESADEDEPLPEECEKCGKSLSPMAIQDSYHATSEVGKEGVVLCRKHLDEHRRKNGAY